MMRTSPGSGPGVPSGQGAPVVTRAMRFIMAVDLASPGLPSKSVTVPRGSQPSQSHSTGTES